MSDTPQKRLELFLALTTADDKIGKAMLRAIEALREAMVLTHDDVEFCFSFLPKTAKYEQLKRFFHIYLNSSLCNDRAWRLSKAIDDIKNGNALETPIDATLTGPDHAQDSYLYRELIRVAKAYGPSGDSTTSVPQVTSNATSSYASGDAPRYHAINVTAAPHLCFQKAGLYLQKLLQRGERAEQIIVLHDSADFVRYHSFFLHYLGHLGITYRLVDSFAEPGIELKQAQKHEPSDSIRIMPLMEIGHHFRGRALIFYGMGEPNGPNRPHCNDECVFTTADIERLNICGFAVPKEFHPQVKRRKLLDCYLAPQKYRRSLFTSLPEDLGVKYHALLPQRRLLVEPAPQLPQHKASRTCLTATELEVFARCPAQYYYRYRLGLKSPDTEQNYHLLFGKLAHRVLEKTDLECPENLALRLEQAFQQAVDEILSRDIRTSPLYSALSEQFTRVSPHIDRLERQLKDDFLYRATLHKELAFEFIFDNVIYRGRFDRVVETTNGNIVIVDYKTGTVDFTPARITKGSDFQVPLYLLAAKHALNKRCIGVLFYDLKACELTRGFLTKGFFPQATEKCMTRGHILSDDVFHSYLEKGVEHLVCTSQRLFTSDFSPTPSVEMCSHCDYSVFCRKALPYGG